MITRREFNQGTIAVAAVAALPLLPTPPQVEPTPKWWFEQIPIERVSEPAFEVQLVDRTTVADHYQVENLSDLVLRIQGYDASHSNLRTVDVIELGPRGIYRFAASHWMEPRFELLAQYRWEWS